MNYGYISAYRSIFPHPWYNAAVAGSAFCVYALLVTDNRTNGFLDAVREAFRQVLINALANASFSLSVKTDFRSLFILDISL